MLQSTCKLREVCFSLRTCTHYLKHLCLPFYYVWHEKRRVLFVQNYNSTFVFSKVTQENHQKHQSFSLSSMTKAPTMICSVLFAFISIHTKITMWYLVTKVKTFLQLCHRPKWCTFYWITKAKRCLCLLLHVQKWYNRFYCIVEQ